MKSFVLVVALGASVTAMAEVNHITVDPAQLPAPKFRPADDLWAPGEEIPQWMSIGGKEYCGLVAQDVAFLLENESQTLSVLYLASGNVLTFNYSGEGGFRTDLYRTNDSLNTLNGITTATLTWDMGGNSISLYTSNSGPEPVQRYSITYFDRNGIRRCQ